MKSESGEALDPDPVRRDGDGRVPPPSRLDLIRENVRLLEEVRQLRAALELWTEVAVQSCTNCECRKLAMEAMTPLLRTAGAMNLVALSEALRARMAETASTALMTGQGENRDPCEEPRKLIGVPRGSARRGKIGGPL